MKYVLLVFHNKIRQLTDQICFVSVGLLRSRQAPDPGVTQGPVVSYRVPSDGPQVERHRPAAARHHPREAPLPRQGSQGLTRSLL